MFGSDPSQRNVDSRNGLNAGWVPHVCALTALVCCLIALAGWATGQPGIAGFGNPSYPMRPLTAAGFGLVALALIAAIWRQRAITLVLMLPVVLIAAGVALDYAGNAPTIADRLLLSIGRTARQGHPHGTLPGPMPIAMMILLAVATLLALREVSRRSKIVVMIASLVLGVTIIAGLAVPLGIVAISGPGQHVTLSLPLAITTASLALALIGWRHHNGWPGLLSAQGVEGRTLRTIFVLVLVAPAVLGLGGLWAASLPGIAPELVEMVEAGAHVLVSAAVLFWAWSRISRENNARWAVTRALDSAPIVLTDAEGRILHWSKGCENLYLWDAGEAVGRLKHDLLATTIDQDWPAMMAEITRTGACEREMVEQRRDGTRLHILEKAQLLPVRAQDAPLVVLSMTDITERERRAAVLAARESELGSILETAPDAMIAIDDRNVIRSFNATAERMFGRPAGEMVGQDFRALMPERFRGQFDAGLAGDADTGGERSRLRSLVGLRSDGTEFPIELALGAAEVGEERIFTAFIRDVTDKLAAQERHAELRDELLHVSRLSAMGEMAAGLAHELNQPLAAATNFLGAAEMLLAADAPDSGKAADLVRMASAQTLRAGEIIQRLRTFVSKGDVEVHAEPIVDVIAGAVSLSLTSVEQQKIGIRYEPDAMHRTILADRVQIQQVLVNLIRNAVDAQRDRPDARPEILLTSRGVGDGMVEIAVSDNGPGIPEEILGSPYKPFNSTKPNGMGIGLSICRRIVEFHGGTMHAENRPEGGARIRFTVPAIGNAELAA